MPKMKPKKGMLGRMKVTGSGKIKCYGHPGKRHLLTKKSSNRKRRLGKSTMLTECRLKTYKTLMGV